MNNQLELYLHELQDNSISNVKYIKLIDKYNIPRNKALIFGSSVLAAHGLRPNKDLDIIVTKDIFNSLSMKPIFEKGIASSGEKFLTDKDHNIEIYYSPGVSTLNAIELFKRADNIQGYLFVSIADMITWKKKMGRPKDLEDIKLLNTVNKDHLL